MRITVSEVVVECITGNIAAQTDVAAVVNAANAQLQIGGGVAGALHRAAGPGLAEECRPLAPIRPGEAVITGAHNLPNSYVIHCLGPVYGIDQPEEKLLADCYRRALQLADQHRIDSLAFPAISTGAFGYPMEQAAGVAFHTIQDTLPELSHVRLIRFVLASPKALDIHTECLEQVLCAEHLN